MARVLRFVSNNPFKIEEAKAILTPRGFDIAATSLKVEELQTEDGERLARDKCLKAFNQVRQPLFVEHTGLYLDSLNGLPGGLTQIFWDKLEAIKFAAAFGRGSDTGVTARTIVAYLDGKKLHIFSGEIRGRICDPPRGDCRFQWDCVFVPAGYELTFAQLGAEKHNISMRRRAFDELAAYLSREPKS